MSLKDAIARKRDRQENTAKDFRVIAEAAAGSGPDYQLTAWLMAAFLNGLTPTETALLTLAMADSGERMDLSELPRPWIDKHSTGGVGDKTTLVLMPLLASCGLTVIKMSGRGLGKTGGTIDKLESVPGFRIDLSPEEMKAQAKAIGIALTGQTPRLAPADKTLYALRDATGTVANIPLITSSILSKKIAGGSDTVVFDVKCGSGAFMKSFEEANILRKSLASVGAQAGLRVEALVTDMDQPLGRTIGNALEVKEAIRVLNGQDSGRFTELILALAEAALTACDQSPQLARENLESGRALGKAQEWFAAQGGDASVFEGESWQTASHQTSVIHKGDAGWIESLDAEAFGRFAMELGAGRRTKADAIDPTVGIELHVEIGTKVEPGQSIFTIHHREPDVGPPDGLYSVSTDPIEQRPIILG